MKDTVLEAALAAKNAVHEIGLMDSDRKNRALEIICEALGRHRKDILAANETDIERAKATDCPVHFIDRLTLTEARLRDISEGVKKLIALSDPIGELMESWEVPSGLKIRKVRVPIGVIGIIYEARPNVTVDALSLCVKSGNAVVLRGSSETIESNRAIVNAIKQELKENGFHPDFIQLIEDTTREGANRMMKLNGIIDVLIPRGGAGLIRNVVEHSSVPVIQTGVGNCHIYVEKNADLDMALEILNNAKTNRPSVCNAAESLLVDRDVAERFLTKANQRLKEHNVKILGCAETVKILQDARPATEEDYGKEFNDYILSVKVVEGVGEAVEWINRYGTQHSDAIITRNEAAASRFLNEVDSAAVYVNASTRFTDGFEFGFGAEMGISTQKLHARGPLGLKELTSFKYTVTGSGQIRK